MGTLRHLSILTVLLAMSWSFIAQAAERRGLMEMMSEVRWSDTLFDHAKCEPREKTVTNRKTPCVEFRVCLVFFYNVDGN